MKFPCLSWLIVILALSGCEKADDEPNLEESDWGEIGWEEEENEEMLTPIGRGKSLFPGEVLPTPPREFRAAWVATVHNLDWPSKPGLPVDEMEKEAIAILDRIVELNMNAVVFQVRPNADAMYESKLEPWSYCLTGKQGRPPERAGFDPLRFWIKEAHSRGIQLHAWFNPYRIFHHRSHGPFSDQSVLKTNPDVVVKLRREGYWWLDPGSPGAREHTLKVVMDVVSRYNIDGVHFDDYFYPYPAYNNNRSFPDSKSYKAYKESGGRLEIKDWRRDSVNQLVRDLYSQIKATKNHVEFGISPFGIWRPGYPKGTTGLDQFNVLYADARLWFRNGWVDYLMPQLYWPVDSKKQSFPVLLKWWEEQNYKDRHLWPGMKIARSGELVKQIKVTREFNSDDSGMCLFNMKGLMRRNRDTAKTLKNGPWSGEALIPPSPWINTEAPLPPQMVLARDARGELIVRIELEDDNSFLYIVNEKRAGKWQPPRIIPGKVRTLKVAPGVEEIAIRGVDRLRNVSKPIKIGVSQAIS